MTRTTRRQTSAQRRQTAHQERIANAATPSVGLWAACGWLVAESRRQGPGHTAAATDAVAGLARLTTDQLTRVVALIHRLTSGDPR